MSETTDDARALHAELLAADEALAEHDRLQARLTRARAVLDEALARAQEAHAALGREAADVEHLESFTAARVWADLRGSRLTDLEREKAEQRAAEYQAARADADVATAHAEHEATRAALAALGDVHGRRTRALEAKEAWVRRTGGPGAAELEQLSAELGSIRSRLGEVREAVAAGRAAAAHLDAAAGMLQQARGWATNDTFFDGGLLGDLAKYDRIRQAEALMRGAEQALGRLAVELADVGVERFEGLGISDLTHIFDMWFDNIFSDWSVRDRIVRALERTGAVRHAVAGVQRTLDQRAADLESRGAALGRRREELLAQP